MADGSRSPNMPSFSKIFGTLERLERDSCEWVAGNEAFSCEVMLISSLIGNALNKLQYPASHLHSVKLSSHSESSAEVPLVSNLPPNFTIWSMTTSIECTLIYGIKFPSHCMMLPLGF